MFCGNCGKQLKDDAVFCGYCGASSKKPTGQTTNLTANTVKPVQPSRPVGQVTKPNAPIIRTKGATQLTLASVVLQVLNLIFWFVPTMSVSEGYSVSIDGNTTFNLGGERIFSLNELFVAASSFFAAIVIILAVLSIALTAKLLLKSTYSHTQRLLFPKFFVILSLFVFLLVLFISLSETSEYSDLGAKAGLTVAGYFYLLSMAGLIVLLFKLSKMLSRKRA